MASVRYAPVDDATCYSLLELPNELLDILTNSDTVYEPFTIKGAAGEEAVLCTHDRTYAIRAIKNSNTLLLGMPHDANELEIVSTLHESLDVAVTLPKVDRIKELLVGQDWSNDEEEDAKISKKIIRYDRTALEDIVRASPVEFENALKSNKILEVATFMRPISPLLLLQAISTLLRMKDESLEQYAEELELDSAIAEQIQNWYKKEWFADGPTFDELELVKDLGKTLMTCWKSRKEGSIGVKKDGGIDLNIFLAEWKKLAGDEAEHLCDLRLLQGTYVLEGINNNVIKVVQPNSLPTDPLSRFNFLFTLKSKWRPEDMQPFLTGIAANDKEKEKWVLKSVRKIKEGNQMYWMPR